MSVEQRLIAAFRDADRVQPSPDLWSRVVHSIEEDATHRRRVITTIMVAAATLAGLIAVGAVARRDGPLGQFVSLPVMELIETFALVAAVAVLGPAIRRFGRGYAADLWPKTPTTATALLRLLDVAYVLVFAGFILITVDFDFVSSSQPAFACALEAVECHTVQTQIESAMLRLGGLVLIMGLLHAVTIVALPVVALVSNSTRVGRALPRWLVIIMVFAGLGIGFFALNGMLGLAGSLS